jgi:hypothetical protein
MARIIRRKSLFCTLWISFYFLAFGLSAGGGSSSLIKLLLGAGSNLVELGVKPPDLRIQLDES